MSRVLTTPKGPIAIRPAVPDDAASVRELRLEALTGSPYAFSADYAANAAEPIQYWANRITNYASERLGIISVAAAEGRLVGMVGLYRENRPKTRHGGGIWGVYVKPDWRGLHVAEALIKQCLDWARAEGLVVVKLGVVTTNTPAITCYARCGFSVYGVEPKTLCYDGVFYDELLMARSIP